MAKGYDIYQAQQTQLPGRAAASPGTLQPKVNGQPPNFSDGG